MLNTRTHASGYIIHGGWEKAKNAFGVKNSDFQKFLKEENFNKDDKKRILLRFLHFHRKRKLGCSLFLRNKPGVYLGRMARDFFCVSFFLLSFSHVWITLHFEFLKSIAKLERTHQSTEST